MVWVGNWNFGVFDLIYERPLTESIICDSKMHCTLKLDADDKDFP